MVGTKTPRLTVQFYGSIIWFALQPEEDHVYTLELAVTDTGMQVKCRNTVDGRWFWVIVGPGGQVITFERDVVWHTSLGIRRTEMWLHDLWLVYRGQDAGHIG